MPIKNGTLTEADRAKWGRMERWALKAIAEKALSGTPMGENLFRCHRYRLGSQVEVWRDPVRGTASYRQLETDHSVWNCPLCAAKVSERRRLDLVEGVKAHRARGGGLVFVTQTVPHGMGDDLGELLGRFLEAQRWMVNQRGYKDLKALHGVLGYVRALETTYGRNGWHPHSHWLLFLERPLEPQEFNRLQEGLSMWWERSCEHEGLPVPARGIGLQLKVATATTEDVVAEYVAKWGFQPSKTPHWTATHELTKAQSKHGRLHGRTPWDLLRSDLVEDDPEALALFREYAHVFKGRHQLQWTPGLRARLKLGEEKTDQELVEEASPEENELFVSFDAATWRRIWRAGMRFEVLEAAGAGDLEGILGIIAACPEPQDDEGWGDPRHRRRVRLRKFIARKPTR